MSLKVWLPLDGNLENKGTSNLTFSLLSSNTTVSTSGKIGSCYANDSYANGGMLSNTTIDLGQNQSMFCWFKFTTFRTSSNLGAGLVSQHRYPSNTGMGITIKSVSSTTGYLSVNTGTGSSRTYNTYCGTTLLQANTWYHGGYTYDGENIRIYVNGICETVQPFTGMSVPADYLTVCCWSMASSGNNVHTDYRLQGSINDVRIYDNALSPAEVKEISRGLVLHYKLDGVNQNLFRYDGLNSYNQEYDMPAYRDTGSFKQFNGCLAINPADYVGKKFTISFDAISPNGTTSLNLYNSNGNPRYFYYSVTLTPPLLGNEWRHFSYTFTNTDRGSSYSVLDHPVEIYMPQQMGCKVRNLKIEFGDFETKWVPFDGNIAVTKIIDSSGYGRHGTVNGTLTLSNDTPRCGCCANFNGTDACIGVPYLTPAELTVSFWMKRNANTGTRQFMYTEWSGITCELQTTGVPTFAVSRSNYPTITGTAITTDSGWVHYCATFDTTNGSKLYQNGILKASNDNVTPISYSISTSYIGRYGTYYYNGKISDFRIYATALSADDILALYKTEAKIPNHSDIHSYAFDEEGSRELITGAIWTNEFSIHTNVPSVNITNGEYVLIGYKSIGTMYIPISPSGHTYVYDIEVSTDASNAFYIGFERYDKDKTARSNNACVYLTGLSGTASERTHQRYHGTVNLSTDGVNPCAYIALRVLNDWSSPNNRKATIHYISLREVSTAQTPTIGNNGVFTVDELKERQKAAFFKDGFVESTEFIEM